MWLLLAREPLPDAPNWPGRRLLAAIDAVAWPLLLAMVLAHMPKPGGFVGTFIAAMSLLAALARLHRAIWINHRYRFTTWRWGRVVAAVLLVGLALKLVLPAFTNRSPEAWVSGIYDQCVTAGRSSLHRSRSVRRHATARRPSRTGLGNL